MHASTDKLPARLWFGIPPDTRRRFAARTHLQLMRAGPFTFHQQSEGSFVGPHDFKRLFDCLDVASALRLGFDV